MELMAAGFLIGVIFSVVMIGGGVLYADYMAKRQHNDACGNDNDICNGDRHRGRDKRGDKQHEIRQLAKKLGVKIGG